jgi:hydrogenase nickel incorporation protein HypA/HybF
VHELSVCVALIEQVERYANEHRASGVEQIVLRIGPLSGIETPLLETAYPLAAAGSIAEGAELVVKAAPVRVECTQCGEVSEVPTNRLLCGHCGSFCTRVTSGEDMILERLVLTGVEVHDSQEKTAGAG